MHGANDAVRRPDDRRFVQAFRLAPIGLLLLDAAGTVVDANAAAATLTGLDVDGLVGRDGLELLHPEDRQLVATSLDDLRRGSVPSISGERRLVTRSGQGRWVQLAMARLDDTGAVVATMTDSTERRETEARLAHQALHDPLTGLPNRALLFDRLAQAVFVAWRGGPGVTVLFLDLDEFKAINDTRGHAVGDRVLVEVARRLGGVLRPADTVARLGGDEFAVVAEGLPREAAAELAERVAERLNGEPIDLGGERLTVVTSIGLAHSSSVPLDVDALINAADDAMYRDKQRHQQGR